MEFTVEFYETEAGRRPVQELLDQLKMSDPGDFAAVLAGLAKLRHRQCDREPLSKALGVRNNGRAIPPRDLKTARDRMQDWLRRTTT